MSIRSSRMYTAPVPKMPPGLIELMEGLAKDVLKNNPVNIYEFCSQHMQKLIEIRDGKVQKKEATITEKIARAQEKVRQRAEKRQKKYDTEMVILKTNEGNATRNKREINEKQHVPTNEVSCTHNPEKDDTEIEQNHNNLQIEHENVDLIHQTIHENKNFELDPSNVTILENICINTESESTPTHDVFLDKGSPDVLLINEKNTNKDIEEENKSEVMVSTNDIENVASSTKETECETKNDVDSQPPNEKEQLNVTTEISQFDKEMTENSKENMDRSDIITTKNEDYSNAKGDMNLNEVEMIEMNDIHNADSSKNAILESVTENNNNNQGITITLSGDHDNSLTSKDTSETEKSSVVDSETQNSFDSSMDIEKAAITIQKVFRAFLFKSKTLSVDDVTNVDFNFLIENVDKEEANDTTVDNLNKERRSLGISRMDSVLQTVNEEKSLSLSTEDSSTLSSAATIIQAHVRGFLVRSKMPLNQTISATSIVDSDIQSASSIDSDQNQPKNKTILNIHIVPEGSNFISRDESIITSVDLSLDGSPHFSSNLHPLGYDKSERRKQLKREDAVQSVSPPSNNSGKLSEDVDSVKEVLLNNSNDETKLVQPEKQDSPKNNDDLSVINNFETDNRINNSRNKFKEMRDMTSDETDVVTPLITDGLNADSTQSNTSTSKLMHSGEFHDIVLPTMISRNNTSVVRGE